MLPILMQLNPAASDLASQLAQAYPSMASYANELVAACERLDIDPAWLANVIWVESGGDPSARNPGSDASGLIQFMPKTAQGLGTTTSAIRGMTGQQQMALVEQYFQNVIRTFGPLKSQEDVLAAVFYPAYIGKPLETFSAAVQAANRGMKNMREYTLHLTSKARLPIEGIGRSSGRLTAGGRLTTEGEDGEGNKWLLPLTVGVSLAGVMIFGAYMWRKQR